MEGFSIFPAVAHHKIQERIFQDPVAHKQSSQSTDTGARLGKSLFVKIVSILSKGEIKWKASVNYMLGALGYKNGTTVRNVLEWKVSAGELKNLLSQQLTASLEYLKFVFLNHVSHDADVVHDVSHALHCPRETWPGCA